MSITDKRNLKHTNKNNFIAKAANPKNKEKKAKSRDSLHKQFGVIDALRKGRETHIDYTVLRNLAKANSIVKIVINRIKNRVVNSPYVIRAKDGIDPESVKREIEYVTNLLKKPNGNDDTFRTIFTKVLSDALTLDNGVIEKVRNAKGDIVELYHVDGATVFPRVDEYGIFESPAYEQRIRLGQTEPDAVFELSDLCVFQANPQPEYNKVGYGSSPLADVITTVITSLQAMLYNADFFDSSKLPPAMINLRGVESDEIVRFKAAFEAQLEGKPWSNAYTNAESLDVKMLRGNNQEMQFYELNLWLARLIFAGYGLSPEEFGFTMDSNRANAESQGEKSKNGGYSDYMDVVAEEINNDIIGDLAQNNPAFRNVEFIFDFPEKLDRKTQAEVDNIYVTMGKVTVDELRTRDGEKPLTEEQRASIQQASSAAQSPLDQLAQMYNQPDAQSGSELDSILKARKWEKYY